MICRCLALNGPGARYTSSGNHRGGRFDQIGQKVKALLDAMVGSCGNCDMEACDSRRCTTPAWARMLICVVCRHARTDVD